ncbi:MAG: glucose 1-dehydrogenase [Planctomycetes bacterium]|nr:glucose 1-dehydrogenase [Planctomycetota bacterium]
MRALQVRPGRGGGADLVSVDEPSPDEGSVLVEALALGVCGTDREIVRDEYGALPPGDEALVLGHESLGRVLAAPAGCELAAGDLVAGVVRHPDPVPCSSCGAGEPDMCKNGRYTERGIKGRHGFGRERYRLEPAFAIKVPPALGHLGVLIEPASVLAKAWEHIERIGRRAHWAPRRALVTGAGPVGLLAALMARQRGLDVHVVDLARDGPKPQLVRDLGATYHVVDVAKACTTADVIVECTGAPALVLEAMRCNAGGGIVCLAGLSGSKTLDVDVGALNQRLVLHNDVIFGTVNANRRHYRDAAEALLAADRAWLERLITRRVPLARWADALEAHEHDVKVVIDFAA